MTYTIERLTDLEDDIRETDPVLCDFLLDGAKAVAEKFDHSFAHDQFDWRWYMRNHCFWICRRDGEPVGALLAQLYPSIYDGKTMILYQDLLYVKPGSGRAAYYLMREFIDFGKRNANHIYTMTTEKTNFKRRSLEKLGFKKIEELYCLELSNG